MSELEEIIEHYRKNGWFSLTFKDSEVVDDAIDTLTGELRSKVGNNTLTLSEYHTLQLSETQHNQIHIELTAFFREKRLGQAILGSQAKLFQGILGPDLDVQSSPYLRIARPHKQGDNIGFHRDTFYGGTPYEVIMSTALVDLPVESALSVLSGSHIMSKDAFLTKRVKSSDEAVFKGSEKHKIGFLYEPKMMEKAVADQMKPIPLRVGQALCFSMATVHGSVVNTGNVTRWTTDVRVKNTLSPVDLKERPDYYETLSRGVVTECAKTYESDLVPC